MCWGNVKAGIHSRQE